jgi:hypothetical protein
LSSSSTSRRKSEASIIGDNGTLYPPLFSIYDNSERGFNSQAPRALLQRPDIAIIAGYCVYREADFLRSSLDSICEYVDLIAILDGRFKDFPEIPEDGTTTIISEAASRYDPQFYKEGKMTQKFVIFDTEPMTETEKRGLFFKMVIPGRFLFILDGDEVCIGDVKAGLDFVRSNPDKEIFWVWVEEEGNPCWKPRIIKVQSGMSYGENHWTILDANGRVLTDSVFKPSPRFATIEDFKLYNFGSKKGGFRGQARAAYRERMRKKAWKENDNDRDRGAGSQQKGVF